MIIPLQPHSIAFAVMQEINACKYLYDHTVTDAVESVLYKNGLKATDAEKAEILTLVRQALKFQYVSK